MKQPLQARMGDDTERSALRHELVVARAGRAATRHLPTNRRLHFATRPARDLRIDQAIPLATGRRWWCSPTRPQPRQLHHRRSPAALRGTRDRRWAPHRRSATASDLRETSSITTLRRPLRAGADRRSTAMVKNPPEIAAPTRIMQTDADRFATSTSRCEPPRPPPPLFQRHGHFRINSRRPRCADNRRRALPACSPRGAQVLIWADCAPRLRRRAPNSRGLGRAGDTRDGRRRLPDRPQYLSVTSLSGPTASSAGYAAPPSRSS